ncbi:hypothetical protein CJD38_07675 [Stenotrophobium rhamnosiphilum]|uniref:Calx-beta domain-containing protein n=2 Tax=Stenotrophobium rhamnosiphilum TaxID=2029166 RepID=A0A2T5MF67_9GAMM|nr:hypothetical protein CJD38_07675 [Stenotrophobium rhamnosiphilum]
MSGVFVDSPVFGLTYTSPAHSGSTAVDGGFTYLERETLAFKVGCLELGSSIGKPVITPFDLVTGASIHTPVIQNPVALTNMARLLGALDADGDWRNGIEITAATSTLASNCSNVNAIRFDVAFNVFDAPNSPAQRFVMLATGRGLITLASAQQELQATANQIIANGAPNRLPAAAAGDEQTVNAAALVSLSGSGADPDGSIVAYEWTQLSGAPVTLSNDNSAAPTFTSPSAAQAQALVFALVVTDNDAGRSQPSRVTINVNRSSGNIGPIVSAGSARTVTSGDAVSLAGSASDTDGTVASVAWTQIDHNAPVTLVGATTLTLQFIAPTVTQATIYTFRLTATDNNGAMSSSDVTVTVNKRPDQPSNLPPTANAGQDQIVNSGAMVSLPGTGTDPEGQPLTYRWDQIGTPQVQISNATTATAQFVAPTVTSNTTLQFGLTVTDNQGVSASDTVDVTVQPAALEPPMTIADASAPQSAGVINFTVTLPAASSQIITVSYATEDGSALAGADYTAASGILNFNPGETSKTIPITIIRHSIKAPDKKFAVQLSAPVNATLSRSRAIGTIVDDNPATLCALGKLCAGAAKRSIAPSKSFLDGVQEQRLPGASVLQQFHLGGYGFGPFEFSKLLQTVTGGVFSDRTCFPGTDTCISGEQARHGYYCRDYTSENCSVELRDQTWVRAFYLSQPVSGGANKQLMFVTIDAVGAGNLIQDGMKAAITAVTGIPADLILIGQTHSHASADLQGLWGGVPDEWVRNTLYKMAAQAAKSAKDAALPAKLTYATGEDAAFANYRRPRVDLNAKTDPNLSVLQAKDNNDNVLGTIVQYAAHPTTIGEDSNGSNGRIVHADYVLGLEDAMEAASGGATTLYYNGPIADASPGGDTVGANDYERVRSRGQCLAQSALALLNPQLSVCSFSKLKRNTVRQTELNPTIEIAQKTATLPVTNPLFLALGASGQISRYYDFSLVPLAQVPVVGVELAAQQPNLPQVATTATTLVSRITIGGSGSGLEIVTVPGETTNSYGQYIRALTQNKNMMLFGLTHNSFGYIIPEDEFSYLDASGSAGFVLPFTGYEEFVSLGPLTAPLLRLTAYNPLFGISTTDPRNIPPSLAACSSNPASNACLVWRQMLQLDYIQRSYAETCRSNLASNVPGDAREQAEAFCDLLDPKTPLYQPCMDAKLPVAVCNSLGVAPGTTPPGGTSPYGEGALGALSQFMADLNGMIAAMLSGDAEGTGTALQTALGNLNHNASTLTAAGFPGVLGLGRDPQIVLANAVSAKREAAPVILTGSQVLGLSVRSAQGVPYPYPSGANITGQSDEAGQLSVLDPLRDPLHLGEVRDAHNGIILYPSADDSKAPMGIPVERIAAYAWKGNAFVEIPVQVDQKFPFFLANAGSSFSVYSGTDEELTYQWDVERWSNADSSDPVAHFASTMQDPVSGFDDDDEIAFMYSDAGAHALTLSLPSDPNLDTTFGLQEVALLDPLSKDPTSTKFVYIGVKKSGTANQWHGQSHYVSYTRDDNADQWIDRNFFRDEDPQKLGTSNTNYGPNHHGKVAPGNGYFGNPAACTGTGANRLCDSTDRFARDGVTVTTDQYVWRATGRWMVREISVADPDHPGLYGSDLIDRWKGRAFQQSPDSIISLVGFEDEQVNWEANSTLLGERCGPVRCMREVWGADSGTNVTKTETFYRGNVTYRYHVRVHPIPPDGLYTAWDYNRSAMIPTTAEAQQGIKGGRYYTMLRPQGVPIDGVNDDVGQIDNLFGQPAFFDFPDPTFNLPLAFDSWEQVSGKGRNGSLVYTFEMKGGTSVVNPIVVPYYRDDACLDDGTGDDPVQRPYPGDSTTDAKVRAGYAAIANKPYAQLTCADRQGAYGEHGIHYLITHDTDNAFLLGKPITEVDGQQWQFMVPTSTPANVAEPYANNVRIPLLPVVVPRPGIPALGAGATQGGVLNYLSGVGAQIQNLLGALALLSVDEILGVGNRALAYVVDGLNRLLYTGGAGTVSGTVSHVLAGDGSLVGIIGGLVNDLTQVVFGTPSGSKVRVGVGVVDMTPDVGYCAGQYCEYTDILDGLAGGDIDPYLTHKLKKTSYGVQSRLTARAIVIEGSNGKKIALLKSDNYVAQDFLIRRVGQILDQGQSGIGYEQILYHVSHNHSAAYSSSPAVGLTVFQDAFDPRFFENQARRLAAAIEIAAGNMKPARMGATVIKHRIYKGNIVRTANADDGTPAGYPLEYNDHGLTVVRFDSVDANGNFSKPIATWMNWGEHPESLDGYNLHSADYLGPLERWVERETGAPLVFSQGDVGSSESSGNTDQRNADDGTVCGTRTDASHCPFGQGALRDWEHKGYAQTERNARFLADDVVKAWNKIGNGDADVVIPLTRNFPVDYANAWVPGPLSHPYPSISNCRTQTTLEGDLGIPAAGLPDCARRDTAIDLDGGAISGPLFDGWQEITNVTQGGMIYALLRAEGVPVPEHYDVPAFSAVEENLRLKLQAFRLGEILLASCACEAQNDLVLNIKSRLDAQRNNIYDGFDWACLMPQYSGDPKYVAACETQKKYFDPTDPLNATLIPGTAAGKNNVSLIARMRAQVHNDARGWDSAQNVALANAESADINKIWGNFTKEEIQDLGILDGYKLPVAVGHAGDYNGYTLSYREYMNRDSYRKALTSYGPHTADYMATRLVRMAAQLKGGADYVPEAHNAVAQVDELRQQALAVVLGQATSAAYDGFHAVLADDMGPVAALAQPQDVTRFAAATFSWRGGTTAQDNPLVTVERCTLYPQPCTQNSEWTQFADMSGEVQTRVAWPQGIPGVIAAYTGTQEWKWTANFEAYSAFPARLGSTPEGQYRFRVNGMVRKNRAPSAYGLVSNAFRVKPWASASGVTATRNSNTASFSASSRSVSYPKSYSGSAFPYVGVTGDAAICDTCSFRPWASVGQLAARGDIVVLRAGVVKATRNATCQIGVGISCTADLSNLGNANGDVVQARIYDQDGNYLFATVP